MREGRKRDERRSFSGEKEWFLWPAFIPFLCICFHTESAPDVCTRMRKRETVLHPKNSLLTKLCQEFFSPLLVSIDPNTGWESLRCWKSHTSFFKDWIAITMNRSLSRIRQFTHRYRSSQQWDHRTVFAHSLELNRRWKYKSVESCAKRAGKMRGNRKEFQWFTAHWTTVILDHKRTAGCPAAACVMMTVQCCKYCWNSNQESPLNINWTHS